MDRTIEESPPSFRGPDRWSIGAPPSSAVPTSHRLGLRLRKARKDRSMTLRAVSRKVGVSLQAISQFEHGHALPTVPTLVALAAAFDVPMGYFFLTASDEKLLALRERAFQLICDLGATRLEYAVEQLKDVSEAPVQSAPPAGD
jgi:transcriptional regulator with XRE-family HTH domain